MTITCDAADDLEVYEKEYPDERSAYSASTSCGAVTSVHGAHPPKACQRPYFIIFQLILSHSRAKASLPFFQVVKMYEITDTYALTRNFATLIVSRASVIFYLTFSFILANDCRKTTQQHSNASLLALQQKQARWLIRTFPGELMHNKKD